METEKNKAIAIAVLIIIVLGALGYYYWKTPRPAVPEVQSLSDTAAQGVLPSLGEAGNPLSNKPDINPTSKTNPFTSVQTNPFQ